MPVVLGHFRLVEQVGSGGSGTVYLGERTEGFTQQVAIKVLHGLAGGAPREQLALSSLDHANIVRLLDHGVAATGEQYLVMEFVAGSPIDEFCDANHLTLAQRLELLQKVLRAVSYAHSRLVVHADLKPTNILVDSSGEPKLLDFGIADSPVWGFAGTRRATPAFMSPEQYREDAVTVSSDIYSLGLIATLLLAGRLPSAERRPDAAPGTKILREGKPEELERLAENRSCSVPALRRAFAGNLDAVLAKALSPEVDGRYQSVESFSQDLRAFQEVRPVTARREPAMERMRRIFRRQLALSVALLLLCAAILAGAIGISVQTARADSQRRLAQARLQKLVRMTGTLDGELYQSLNGLPHADEARQTLLQATTHALDELSADASADPALLRELAHEYAALAELQRALPGDAHAREADADEEKGRRLLEPSSSSPRGIDGHTSEKPAQPKL